MSWTRGGCGPWWRAYMMCTRGNVVATPYKWSMGTWSYVGANSRKFALFYLQCYYLYGSTYMYMYGSVTINIDAYLQFICLILPRHYAGTCLRLKWTDLRLAYRALQTLDSNSRLEHQWLGVTSVALATTTSPLWPMAALLIQTMSVRPPTQVCWLHMSCTYVRRRAPILVEHACDNQPQAELYKLQYWLHHIL